MLIIFCWYVSGSSLMFDPMLDTRCSFSWYEWERQTPEEGQPKHDKNNLKISMLVWMEKMYNNLNKINYIFLNYVYHLFKIMKISKLIKINHFEIKLLYKKQQILLTFKYTCMTETNLTHTGTQQETWKNCFNE